MRRILAGLLLIASSAGAGTVTINGNSYTYTDHPRVFLDGPGGTLTTRLADPDGVGVSVAPAVTESAIAYAALVSNIRGFVATSPPQVPYTPGSTMAQAAIDWYMDNSQTASLTAAKYWLNNIERFVAPSTNSPLTTGCDILGAYCGDSYTDWSSLELDYVALAYTLVRSQLSAAERTAFAKKVLNDEAAYGASCDNALALVTGASANYTSGATIITGSGLDGLTAGRTVYIRTAGQQYGGFATVSTVDSASQVTIAARLYNGRGAAYGNASSASVYEIQPWTDTTCGILWKLHHHPYAPQYPSTRRATTLTNTITASDLSVVVNSVVGFPGSYPYYLLAGAEVMKVTNAVSTTLTVERAQFGTTASARFAGASISYGQYLPGGSTTGDTSHNLTLTKVTSDLLIGLALLDDDVRAETVVDNAVTFLTTRQVPIWKKTFAGQLDGGPHYAYSRYARNLFYDAAALEQLTGTPSLSIKGGSWLQQIVGDLLARALPPAATTALPWGSPSVAASPTNLYLFEWGPIFSYLYPSTDDLAYFNYWLKTQTNQYTAANLDSVPWIPLALIYKSDSETATDYTGTLATTRVNNITDTTADNRPLASLLSRSAWTGSDVSVLYVGSPVICYNPNVTMQNPGGYKLYKGSGWVLTENDLNHTGTGTNTNMLIFGGAANLIASVGADTCASFQNPRITATKTGTGWAYGKVDTQAAYTTATAVTRAQRNLVHFKASGQPDYLVVYDTAATSSAKTIGQNLHYDKTGGQASSITDTLPNIVWTGPDRRVSTKVVLPSGTGAARTASSPTNSFREYVCASTDGSTCASVTSAAFLLVHKPSTSTSDIMPTVNALATIDSDFDGVEIADASAPSVAVFAKAGTDQNAGSFTTTLAGTAQIIVSGLVAGTYDVTKDAGAYLSSQTVDANGVLAFTGTAAAYALSQTGVATPPTITTTTLSNGVLGQAYSATLQASDGAIPLTWDVSAGSLCNGLTLSSGGILSGTPTTAQTCNFTARVTDDLAQTDTQALSLTIQTPPPTLSIRAQPGSNSVVLTFGTPGLSSDQSCDAVVSAVSQTCNPPESAPCSVGAGSATSSGGAATRALSVGSLTASTTHAATVTCGTVAAGSVSFTTKATASGPTTFSFKAKAPAWVKTLATAENGNTSKLGLVACFDSDCSTVYACTILPNCPGDVCTVSYPLPTGIHYLWHRWSWLPLYGVVPGYDCGESPIYFTSGNQKGFVAIP